MSGSRVSPHVPPHFRCLPTWGQWTVPTPWVSFSGVPPCTPSTGIPHWVFPPCWMSPPPGCPSWVSPQCPRPQVTPPYWVSPPQGSPLGVPLVSPPLGCPPGCPHPSDLLIHQLWSVSFLSVQNAPTSLTLTGEKLTPEAAAGALPSLG